MINILSNGCCSKGGRKCCFYTYEQDDHQPEIGLLKSAIVRDNKNKKQYIYDSLGVYTEIQGAGDEYVTEEELYDLLNKSVVSDIDIYGDDSTLTVEKVTENLYTGATETTETPLPVASETEAGVMNSATFSSVKENSENIDSILGGAVALSGIPASPTQAELTQAWKTATGRDDLVNRAQIYDQDNQKVWTYYSNSETWYPSSNTPQVTVSQWTNTSAGIAKGSTITGQIFAEADGTGSVNGWDALNSAVSTNTTNITNLSNNKVDKVAGKGLSTNDFTDAYKQQVDDNTTAISGKQDTLTAGDHIDITSNVISAEGYISADDPTTATVQPSVTTSMIQDGAVTADKIADSGWVDCTINADFEAYGGVTANKPQVRKIGNVVYLRGILSPKTAFTSGNSNKVVCTMPSGYRPTMNIYTVAQGSSMNRWTCAVQTDGNIGISRYSDNTAGNTVAAGAWLPFNMSWVVG